MALRPVSQHNTNDDVHVSVTSHYKHQRFVLPAGNLLGVHYTWQSQDEAFYDVNVFNRASLRSEHQAIKTIDNWTDSSGNGNEWILAFTVDRPRSWGFET